MKKRHISPVIFDSGEVTAAVSTRNGGVSSGDYLSLNMGKSTKDNPLLVLQNRKLFFDEIGIREEDTALSHQVHGDAIYLAEQPCRENGHDALITDKKNLFLVISVADCIPVLIYEPARNVVAAIHSGWRGTVAGIVPKTIEKMKSEYGATPAEMKIFIGPGIGHKHFEVGKEVADHFPKEVKNVDLKTGKCFVDLKKTITLQCQKTGILKKNMEISPFCTFKEQHLFFSHRRDNGKTGRMVAVIGMK